MASLLEVKKEPNNGIPWSCQTHWDTTKDFYFPLVSFTSFRDPLLFTLSSNCSFFHVLTFRHLMRSRWRWKKLRRRKGGDHARLLCPPMSNLWQLVHAHDLWRRAHPACWKTRGSHRCHEWTSHSSLFLAFTVFTYRRWQSYHFLAGKQAFTAVSLKLQREFGFSNITGWFMVYFSIFMKWWKEI